MKLKRYSQTLQNKKFLLIPVFLDDFTIFEFIRQLLLQKQHSDSYANLIAGIWDDVTNKEKLEILLVTECLPKISPYDYDRM